MKNLAWICVVSCLSHAAAEEILVPAKNLFDQSQTANLRYSQDSETIELAVGQVYEDDGPAAGYTYGPNEEPLGDEIVLRKELFVEHPEAESATLLVARGGELEVTINGQPAKLESQGKTGNYWQAYGFEPALLVPGKNTILIRGSGMVWIAREEDYALGSTTRTTHPNRSAKSTDGGRTWDDAHLGKDGSLDGEYYVRVHLKQHASQGTLLSNVTDLGNLARQPLAPPLEKIERATIELSGLKQPEGTSVRLEVRTSSSPQPAGDHWSPWTELKPEGSQAIPLAEADHRYLQARLTLTSEKLTNTPRVGGLRVTAEISRPRDWTQQLTFKSAYNPEPIRSSIPFEYEPYDRPELAMLRREHKLDEVVAGAETELELIERLAVWSSQAWPKLGHLGEVYPAWNALEILSPHSDGSPIGGFCQQYNLVFLQACESFGIPGRVISLGPGDQVKTIRGGHETVEVWSNQYRKWIYVDGNTAWYMVDAETQVPLSLLELRERQLAAFAGREMEDVKLVKLAETRYDWKGITTWPALMEVRMVPRSNFLEQTAPLPLNQGMRGWFWTGHYVWTDDELPARRLYPHLIAKRRNWEWTLNHAAIRLEALSSPGQVRVHLDPVMPGLDQLLARIDDQDSRPVEDAFTWELHPGINRLEVVPRNTAGRDGIATYVELNYQPVDR